MANTDNDKKLQELFFKLAIENDIENKQLENITILGIFSAIVITFVAGLVFSSSVLQNINKVSIYRLTFVIWLLGFILINALQKLFNFITAINAISKNSGEPIKKGKCLLFFKNNFVNIIFIIGLLLIMAAWFCDLAGCRYNW